MKILVKQFLQNISEWAKTKSDIVALALVGSYARNTAKETSDIDLILIVENPLDYLEKREWINVFGKVKEQKKENYGLVTSIRVWYENDLEVEFGITDDRWITRPLDKGTRRIIDDGIKILFENNSNLSQLIAD